MPKNTSLFLDSFDRKGGASDILFGRSMNQSLGGNLHDLTDRQIQKLIHLKFENNPITLIRQISKDLISKETELILLRKESFSREQLLLKLLGEYGNLSSLEVDQKLNALKVYHNVDHVLHDMIGDAMIENLESPKRTVPAQTPSIVAPRSRQISSEQSHNTLATSSLHPSNNIPSRTASDDDVKAGSWLSNWFNIEDSNQANNSRSHSRSFGMMNPFGSSTSLISSASEQPKAPVELESIRIDQKTSESDATPAGVDKYGFYNEISSIPLKPSANNFSEGLVLGHNNKLTQLLEIISKPLSERGSGKPLDSEILIAGSNNNSSGNNGSSGGPQTTTTKSLTLVGTNDMEVSGTYTPTTSTITISTLKEISKMHDKKNKQFEDEWDSFFKSLLKDYYQCNNPALSNEKLEKDVNNAFNELYTSTNEIFGVKGLNLVKLDKMIFKQFMPQNAHSHVVDQNITYLKKLRKLVNKIGIPVRYRSQLWFELSGGKNLKVPGEFDRLYEVAISNINSNANNGEVDQLLLSNLNQVNLDLHRTMPSNIYFNDVINSQPGPNFYRLQRILYAFVVYKPSIGYCQGMNKIISNLLLGVLNSNTNLKLGEEDIFWIFVGFIDELLPTYSAKEYNFFDSRSLKYIGIDQKILLELLFPKFLPKISSHFNDIGVQIEYITLNWWILIFTENCLPIEIWIKYFDNLLVSNVEMQFFCMLLSLFKNFEKLLLHLKSADDVYLIMKNLNQNSSTKTNLNYFELMVYYNGFEKKMDFDLQLLREKMYL